MITVLAGGVGAARFLRGLVRVVTPRDVCVIVNVADDLDLHGLRICPDLDSITYWLAGGVDRERQWGRRDEHYTVSAELSRYGADTWFTLGDRDLATHLYRTGRLAEGATLTEVTAEITAAWDLELQLLPATNDRIETRIHTTDGRDLHFQEYWVREAAAPEVDRVEVRGAEDARVGDEVRRALRDAEVIVIAPSNPVVSIGPILTLNGVRPAIAGADAPVVGVSPIVGGDVVRGMADRLLPAVAAEVTAAGVAELYADLLDAWVVDDADADLAPGLNERLGIEVAVTDTIMDDVDVAAALARTTLAAAGASP
ncbi:MAG: 2-phospho-L-lactate transferase [Nitriliruptorales bacterium]|nr:2-phospho-L-lactate transferase [Nitriliruptorales bacterium]